MELFKSDMNKIRGAKTQGEIIQRLYNRYNLNEICADLRLNPAAVALVRRDDVAFDNEIREAQAFCVDMMTDRLEHIEDEEENPIMAKVISENIKWLASKRLKQIYGDKVEINHNHTINIQDAMIEARNRTMNIIDHKPLKTIDAPTDSISVEVIEQVDEIDCLS